MEHKVDTVTASAVLFRCHFAQQVGKEELEEKAEIERL